jgi:hypothetical protein
MEVGKVVAAATCAGSDSTAPIAMNVMPRGAAQLVATEKNKLKQQCW